MGKLEKEYEQILKSVNRGGYFRCSICNSVSNESIETNIGDYIPHQSFTNDPKDPLHFICTTCADEIEELRQEYNNNDGENSDEWETG